MSIVHCMIVAFGFYGTQSAIELLHFHSPCHSARPTFTMYLLEREIVTKPMSHRNAVDTETKIIDWCEKRKVSQETKFTTEREILSSRFIKFAGDIDCYQSKCELSMS